jgi:predicted nucleic acid-binding protein
MTRVLDASVGLKWVLPEVDSDKAIRIRDDFARGIRGLIAPDIFPIEVAHTLAKTERRGLILPGEGAKKLADVAAFLPDLHPYLPLLPRAFEIASAARIGVYVCLYAARIGVYDCLYVALAEREGCDLITSDQRLLSALAQTMPFIIGLTTLP